MNRPDNRTEFRSAADELNHISDLIQYASDHAEPLDERVVTRFGAILKSCGDDDGSIALQEHWANFHEVNGDFEKASFHRMRQIQLVEELFHIGGPIGPVNNEYLASALRSLAKCLIAMGKHAEAAQNLGRANDVIND